MRNFLLSLILVIPVAAALPVQASVIKAGEKVVIDKPSSENHYLAGGEVYINAPIDGDVFAAAGEVEVNAPISEDLMLGGGEIRVNGPIAGDMRVTGGKVLVSRNIGGDLIVAGGEVTLESGVAIGGDLLVLGGKVLVKGSISGETRVAGGDVTFDNANLQSLHVSSGKIDLDATVSGSSHLVAETIRIGSGTRFEGNVVYWQKEGEMDLSPYLGENATARFDPNLRQETSSPKMGWLIPVYWFLSGVLLIVLLVQFFSSFFRRHAGILPNRIGSSLGYGVLYLIGVPIVALFAIGTIIALPIGFIMLAGYGITIALAGSLVAVMLAYELEKRQGQKWSKGKITLVAIAISLFLKLVAMIPLIGMLVLPCFAAIALGYLVYIFRNKRLQAGGDPDIV